EGHSFTSAQKISASYQRIALQLAEKLRSKLVWEGHEFRGCGKTLFFSLLGSPVGLRSCSGPSIALHFFFSDASRTHFGPSTTPPVPASPSAPGCARLRPDEKSSPPAAAHGTWSDVIPRLPWSS